VKWHIWAIQNDINFEEISENIVYIGLVWISF
jgi:hypothetical protein